ncbi:MAG: RNA polymerase sigma factor [Defluviitaleaceae bacterium]|nr:RNA polymerase sigma factor [Defluviitaleaceae bacterium]
MIQDIRDYFIRLAEGHTGALDDIYNELSVRIFNYARTITKSKEISEDVTHDVFIRIISMAERLATIKNPVAYIMVATRNLAYDHLRKNKYAATLDEANQASVIPTPFNMLPDALSRLPANQRETIYLHHICGFTQKEVAKITCVPLVTVKWRCRQAKQKLQEYFNKEA